MFEKSADLETLAKKVISESADLKHLDNPSLHIVYMYCDKEKTSNGKKVYADTTKLNDKTKAVAGCDFIITFYRPNCSALDEARMKILMYHELRHVGFKDGKFSILPHEVEDFKSIIEQHGMNWVL